MKVKQTERGWAGHFICADRCLFRRNTLLEYKGIEIVVSTVGLMKTLDRKEYDTIGYNRYYETMAFHADKQDTRYHDIDVSKEISFESNRSIDKIDADDEANVMHDNVVSEFTSKLYSGERFELDG